MPDGEWPGTRLDFKVVLASDALMYHIEICPHRARSERDDIVSRFALASSPTALDQDRAARRATASEEPDWRIRALCRSGDPELLFVSGARQREVASICRNCPVKWECAADALDNKVEYGVWGGLTERQRRSLLKKYPEVDSWATFLARHQAHRGSR